MKQTRVDIVFCYKSGRSRSLTTCLRRLDNFLVCLIYNLIYNLETKINDKLFKNRQHLSQTSKTMLEEVIYGNFQSFLPNRADFLSPS